MLRGHLFFCDRYVVASMAFESRSCYNSTCAWGQNAVLCPQAQLIVDVAMNIARRMDEPLLDGWTFQQCRDYAVHKGKIASSTCRSNQALKMQIRVLQYGLIQVEDPLFKNNPWD